MDKPFREGVRDGKREGDGRTDGGKRRTGAEESVMSFYIIPFAHVGIWEGRKENLKKEVNE